MFLKQRLRPEKRDFIMKNKIKYLIKASTLCIHEVIDIIMNFEDKNLIFAAF